MSKNNNTPSLLAVFAHPDDESFGVGGTLAKYVAEGVQVTVLTATRGELGEIADPSLATRETLGQVREGELRCAAQTLGVDRLTLLDYVDGQLPAADSKVLLGKIVRAIREVRPQVILTFGPEGVTGHLDHIVMSQVATGAFELTADPGAYREQMEEGLSPHRPAKLYYHAPTRTRFARLAKLYEARGLPTPFGEEDVSTFGVPDEQITTVIDVESYLETKLRAVRCHRTQLPANNFYRVLSSEELRQFFSQETFHRAQPPVAAGEGIETDFFARLR